MPTHPHTGHPSCKAAAGRVLQRRSTCQATPSQSWPPATTRLSWAERGTLQSSGSLQATAAPSWWCATVPIYLAFDWCLPRAFPVPILVPVCAHLESDWCLPGGRATGLCGHCSGLARVTTWRLSACLVVACSWHLHSGSLHRVWRHAVQCGVFRVLGPSKPLQP
jgi:hypothetical protein